MQDGGAHPWQGLLRPPPALGGGVQEVQGSDGVEL